MSQDLAIGLQQACEILHVAIHRPRMTFKIPKAEVSLGEMKLSAAQVTAPSWKLMPAELGAALDKIENKVGNVLEQYGVKFRSRPDNSGLVEEQYQLRGVYLVPALAVEELLGRLQELDGELKDVVREWANDPGRLVAAVQLKLGDDAFEKVKNKIPSGAQLLAATSLEFVSLPMCADLEGIRESNNTSLLRLARQRTSEMLSRVSESIVAQPRQELADAVQQLQELIGRDGRVTAKSFAPIRRAIEKLGLFDFVVDAELRKQIDALSARMDAITPSEQDRATAESSGLLGILDTLRNTALQETTINKYAGQLGGFRVSVK